MRRIVERFATTTRALHYVSGALIVGLMLLTAANILSRWTMGNPIRGTIELTEIGMVAIVFLGFAYAQVREDHIRVDLLYDRLGSRGRTILGVFAAIISLVTVAVMAWRLHDYVGVLRASGRTTSSLSIPLYWVAWVGVAGLVIYAIGIVVTGFRRAQDDGPRVPVELEHRPDIPPTDER